MKMKPIKGKRRLSRIYAVEIPPCGTETLRTRRGDTSEELQIAQAGGKVVKLAKSSIAKTEPMSISLMPTGLDKALTKEERRDLMMFLLTIPGEKFKVSCGRNFCSSILY